MARIAIEDAQKLVFQEGIRNVPAGSWQKT